MKNCIKLLIFTIKYLAFWIALFFFFRTFFLLYNYQFSTELSLLEILKTFRYGFTVDLSMAAYLSIFPVFMLFFSPVVRPNILYAIIFVYSIIILTGISILGLFDIGLYADWGMRLSTQLLPALETPKGMLACVTPVQLVLLLLVEIAIVTGFIYLYRFLFKLNKIQDKQRWYAVLILVIYSGFLFITMRGGVQTTPVNLSRAYFSTKLYANHTATNPYWSFFYRLINSESKVKEQMFMDSHLCDSIMRCSIQGKNDEIPILIKPDNNEPVNVILIILESFSNKAIEPLGGEPDLTPNFNRLAQEGILFKNFYATGNRSDKGIASLLAAYPAMIGSYSILYFPEKMKHLDYLSPYFNKKNYKTHYYYAGEIEFYNTKTLVLQSGYEHIVSVTDFPASAKQQNWGVPDAIFYKRITDDLETFQTPFFLVAYTISSHTPYDIPGIPKRNYENAVSYSDKCLGDFVEKLKNSVLWDNTLLIITSDHGIRSFKNTSISEPLTYQIPMLWIGGVIDSAFVNENTGMQTDLTTTLVQQLQWQPNPNPFSKNLFGNSSYAFYFNTNGYGFVSPELAYYNDIETNRIKNFYITNEQQKDSLLRFSEAFVNYLHSDFKKR
ncbi:MAG: sulfatase-like hydrolase/transferase [Bacteroidetes bacterium]|nr:sulfatase-like hydrolase/transferase [Bacteroidota bacterium]MCL1969038.1 sulfatase-like hydrolase/transferase [Bacteroidota bacterium]